jgi:diphosphomevalonate decarboxylase
MKASAIAHSNLALVKYWGKKNSALNIPAVGSISITLKELSTRTSVHFDPKLDADILILNDSPADQTKQKRVSSFLNIVRQQANMNHFAKISSANNYPTGAGLASSASGFCALSVAASRAANLDLNPQQLSVLARQGSGSAARSIYGGFVEMKMGEKSDGSDSFATQIADENHWDLTVIVAITTEREKRIGSTDGMTLTAQTSPYYKEWISSSRQNLDEMRTTIIGKNFEKLGEISEQSCLKMHALAMSANPGLIYWNSTTTTLIHLVRELRQNNIQCYFTIDAGPQVKILCLPKDSKKIENFLKEVHGVKKTIHTSLGPGATLIETTS